MKKRILIEASGSLVSNWVIKAIKESGHVAIASDITEESVGRFLADEFVTVPKSDHPDLWSHLESILVENKIDLVIPSLDETLILWAKKKKYLKSKYGIDVIISNMKTIETFIDKYRTFLFFSSAHIPTPATSLQKVYPLVKPRFGRGGKGIEQTEDENIDMKGKISQEFIEGEEYTIDCLIDHKGKPIYIVPRKRLVVKDGKSVNGIVVNNARINEWVTKICKQIKFFGPINIQCIESPQGIKFIEINPRIGGGMALGLAATENWISLITKYLIKEKEVLDIKKVKVGLRMYRYYEEVFK